MKDAMATRPLPSIDRLSPTRGAALIAGATGIAAALLILWILGDVVIATAFLATAIVVGGLLVAGRRLLPAAAPAGEVAVAWSLARALAQASAAAVARSEERRAGKEGVCPCRSRWS